MLSGSELWLLRLMADRGLALLDAGTLLIVIEERGELRVAASSGRGTARLRIVPVQGSALGALHLAGEPLSLDRPRGKEAAWLHELGLEARAALVEPLSMEGQGRGLVIALRSDGGFRGPDRQALSAFAASVAQRLAAERSVEIERLRYGVEAREHERTRWAREIHDESIQGIGAVRMKLANARDHDGREAMEETVDAALDGLDREIDGLRHLITELRPAALDDLGLEAALRALARRAQAIDELKVEIEIDLDPEPDRPERDRSRNGRHLAAIADPAGTLSRGRGRADQAGTQPGGPGRAVYPPGARRLDPELESTTYRIVQEALTNVSRHAQATKAVVNISERDGVIRASVTDDGCGLPDGARLGPRGDGLEGGFGMSGMRERAELVGGELQFARAPGRGTVVCLTVPLAGRPATPSAGTAAECPGTAAEGGGTAAEGGGTAA